MKVFINPGHAPEGNPDPGACNVYTGLRECDVAAEVGRLTAHYLNAVGIETEILQSDSLYEVCQKANASEADLFISIHCNSAANPAAKMARKHGTAMVLRMEPILPSTSMGRYCGPLTQQTGALRKLGLVSTDSMS